MVHDVPSFSSCLPDIIAYHFPLDYSNLFGAFLLSRSCSLSRSLSLARSLSFSLSSLLSHTLSQRAFIVSYNWYIVVPLEP